MKSRINKEVKKPVRTSLQIRRSDEEIYHKVNKFNFSEFISDALNNYGLVYANKKAKEYARLAK